MQYKRIIIACLIVVLALCASVFAVSAAETTPLNVTVGVADATPAVLQSGETFDVSISIDSNPNLGVFQLELQYDAENLEYVSSKNGVVFTDPSGVLKFAPDENKKDVIKYEYIGINSNKTGVLVTLTFKAKTTISPKGAFMIDTDNMNGANVEANAWYGSIKGGQAIALAGNPEAIHTHVLTSKDVDATCLDNAYTRYNCSVEGCNYQYDDVKANTAKGHTPGAAATCTTNQTCTVCNVELAPAKGHTPGAEATCTTAQTCTVCNAELAPAKGHTPGAEATCTTNQTCTVCNVELAPALGHKSEKIPAVEPTYKAEGATEGEKCSVCGEVLKAPTAIEKKSSAWIWITVICSVVVIGGGVAALIVVLNKKKKAK